MSPIEPFFLKKSVELIAALGKTFLEIRQQRQAEIDDIQKTYGNLDYLVPFYVIPDGQNVNPADSEEDNTGLVAKNDIFDLLNQFISKQNGRINHAFILSDAGMGKSSCLVMIYLAYLNKFIQPDFKLKLLKLGPDTLAEIEETELPHKTVLLLDALDEDSQAWENFYNRLQLILQATSNFKKTIITCRTQFFPIEKEEDGRAPGVITLGGFYCSKLFLSPFNDDQVQKYLEKRFSKKQEVTKALKIIEKMQSLKFRPMLLSYIDFFLERDSEPQDSFSIYSVLVDEWLNRELRKGNISEKGPVLEACSQIANYMYDNKKKDIDFGLLRDKYLSVEGVKNLEYMTIEGRSLLHRGSEGNYKFAHYSILEYFVAKRLIVEPNDAPNSDQVIRFLEDMVAHHKARTLTGLNLNSFSLKSVNVSNVIFAKSALSKSEFADSIMTKTDFSNARLHDVEFDHCSLAKSNSNSASFELTRFWETNLSGSKFSNTTFIESRIDNCSLAHTEIKNCSMRNTLIGNCDFSGSDIREIEFDHSELQHNHYQQGAILKSLRATSTQIQQNTFKDVTLENFAIEKSSFAANEFADSKLHDVIFKQTTVQNFKLLGSIASNFEIKDCDVHNLQFSNSKIKGFRIVGTNASNLSYTGSRIEEAEFNSTIRNLDLSHATADNVKASGGDYPGFRAHNSRLKLVDFSASSMNEANLQECILHFCKFERAKLEKSNFKSCEMADADFKGASLKGSTFEDAKIAGANFSFADLKGVNFARSILSKCNFNRAFFDSKTAWPENFDFSSHNLIGPKSIARSVDFSNLNLVASDFEHAIFTGANFNKSNLEGTFFKQADLERCSFDGCNLTKCDLSGANLAGANLRNCDLSGSVTIGANFNGAFYNLNTKLPPEIDPQTRGMRSVV